jgi:3D (Asp-Asp-Asp) domain-containing protein
MTHKYNYNYKPTRHIPYRQIGYILFWAIVYGLTAYWVYQGYEAIPQPAIASPEPLVTITNDYYTETATTSAYTKWETCPNTDCITASGTRPQNGITVACPRTLPFGTQVEIQGSVYTCQDRTHSRFDGRYDIYFGDDQQAWLMAKEYGLQEHLIKIYR